MDRDDLLAEFSEYLGVTCRELGNIVTMAKGQGGSSELAREMERLEATRKTMEVRLHELAAKISHRKRAVYDVDAIQWALQHFARFIYKLPVEQQIKIIRLLVGRVLLFKDRVRVELHELPIPDLQRALDIPTGPRSQVRIPATSRSGGQKTTANGTAVAEVRQNWRGRR